MLKTFNLILVSAIIIQIIFSFFYSSEIITQNNNLYENQQQYQSLKLEKQTLEKKLSDYISIYKLNQENNYQNLSFIKQKIDLR